MPIKGPGTPFGTTLGVSRVHCMRYKKRYYVHFIITGIMAEIMKIKFMLFAVLDVLCLLIIRFVDVVCG